MNRNWVLSNLIIKYDRKSFFEILIYNISPSVRPLFYRSIYFSACDKTFESTALATSKNGSFEAPVFLNPEMVIQQCTFTFIARDNERVKVEFENFDLEGTPPE